ncbi:hypothetical protein RJ641_029308 [Dillenia turbinata]|uniref:Uncharacterized protein n=1 Tax=Dillenia turbinata TaxID=194707 RepID=A0AAN8W5Y3_9MAGN
MGVLDIYNASATCMVSKSKIRSRSFEGNQRRVISMASSVPVKQVYEGQQQQQRLTGDSFIRPHLRNLSPYQAILPFEVIMGYCLPFSYSCFAILPSALNEHVLSTRLGRKPEEIIKLDANENPYGPPPEANLDLQLQWRILRKDDLAQMGVMIRHYNKKELKGFVRVSVGKPEHTDILMQCLKRFS